MRVLRTLLAAAVLFSVLAPEAFSVTPTFTSVMNAQAVRDASGFIYAFGYTDDPAFPTTHGAYQPQFIVTACGHYMGIVSTYCAHGYVAKLNPAGKIVWCTFLEGSVQDQISALALDSAGNIWVTGTTQSPDFPITANAIQQKPAYTFLSEISPDGSQLLYSTFIGGNYEQSLSINVDPQDKVYIFGYSQNPDFAATPGAYNSRPAGCGSVAAISQYCLDEPYARKFDPSANQLVYATLIGPVESPDTNIYLTPQLSAVDEKGVFYVAGYTHRSDYPITQGVYSHPLGDRNMFITAIDPSGSSLVFSTVIGGSGENMPTSIVRDTSGNIYAAGTCQSGIGLATGPSQDFPVTSDALQSLWGPGFLLKLSPDASTLLYSTFVGRFGLGTHLSFTIPQQIKLDSEGKVHMLISSEESDIPLSGDGYNPCYPEPDSQITTNWLHFTYARFSNDLRQIEYATNVPGMWGLPPYFFDTSGNFYLGFGGPLTTSRHPVGYFTILNASQAPNPGPVCIAQSVTKTLTSTAPGLLMSVYGPGIGPAQPTWAVPVAGVVPNQMEGVQVLFDGVAAPILYGDPNEVDVVVPFGVRTSGTVTISVVRDGNVLGMLYNNAVAANPYLFSVDGTGYGASGWYADGTPNSASKPASVGDVLTFYGTGVGNVISPLPDGSIPTSANAFSANALSVCGGVNIYVGDAPGQVEGVVQVNCRLTSVVDPRVVLREPGGASSWSASNIIYVK